MARWPRPPRSGWRRAGSRTARRPSATGWRSRTAGGCCLTGSPPAGSAAPTSGGCSGRAGWRRRPAGWRRGPKPPAGREAGSGPVVAGGRERMPLGDRTQLALVLLPADLGPGLVELVRLGEVRGRRGVGSRRHLARIVVVDSGFHPFLLGQPGQPVVIEAVRGAAVLAAVPPELLIGLVGRLLCHRGSKSGDGEPGWFLTISPPGIPAPVSRARAPWPPATGPGRRPAAAS